MFKVRAEVLLQLPVIVLGLPLNTLLHAPDDQVVFVVVGDHACKLDCLLLPGHVPCLTVHVEVDCILRVSLCILELLKELEHLIGVAELYRPDVSCFESRVKAVVVFMGYLDHLLMVLRAYKADH